MRLEQLLYFKITAETQSIRKASHILFVSPQCISKSILQLEEEFHVSLFHRSKSGMYLTNKGKEAYSLVLPIIEASDALAEHFHITKPTCTDGRTEPVSICCCSVLEPLASGSVSILMNRYPDVQVQTDNRGSDEIIQFLISSLSIDEKPDLILLNGSKEQLDMLKEQIQNDYLAYFIYEDTLCLQIPQDDPLAELDSIPLKTITTLPMLLFSSNPMQQTATERLLAQMGFSLKNVSRTSNIDTCSRVALNQHRYCFVGYPSVEFRPLANVVYIPLECVIKVQQLLLVKKKRKNIVFCDAFMKSFDDIFNLQIFW